MSTEYMGLFSPGKSVESNDGSINSLSAEVSNTGANVKVETDSATVSLGTGGAGINAEAFYSRTDYISLDKKAERSVFYQGEAFRKNMEDEQYRKLVGELGNKNDGGKFLDGIVNLYSTNQTFTQTGYAGGNANIAANGKNIGVGGDIRLKNIILHGKIGVGLGGFVLDAGITMGGQQYVAKIGDLISLNPAKVLGGVIGLINPKPVPQPEAVLVQPDDFSRDFSMKEFYGHNNQLNEDGIKEATKLAKMLKNDANAKLELGDPDRLSGFWEGVGNMLFGSELSDRDMEKLNNMQQAIVEQYIKMGGNPDELKDRIAIGHKTQEQDAVKIHMTDSNVMISTTSKEGFSFSDVSFIPDRHSPYAMQQRGEFENTLKQMAKAMPI